MKRVAVYARVSTKRQAKGDISIPDQLKQAEDYCTAKGWEMVATYVEAGASATDDKRPEFQRMITEATKDPSPYDTVLVYTLSRFYRDAISQGLYRRRLEEHGVLLKSVTQEFGEGDHAELVQTILAAADQHTSRETAKHVRRSMVENARQGFWNGSQPPFGYKATVAEMRGEKAKKKLAVDAKEAEIVKLAFGLYLNGDGTSGPLGIKGVADSLNRRGFKNRNGNGFYTSVVEKMLKRTAYMGEYFYNRRDSKMDKPRPREEWVKLETPVIIDPKTFEAVQQRLKAHAPDKVQPRTVRNGLLLSGMASCGCCKAGMMLRTGKGGRYRYYNCASTQTKSTSACEAPARLPEAKLDSLVTDALLDRILAPERLKPLLTETFALIGGKTQDAKQALKRLRADLKEAERRIENLFSAIEDGLAADTDSFRNRLTALEDQRSETLRLIAIKEHELALPLKRLSNGQIERMAKAIRDTLKSGPTAFRKAYLKLLIDRIEVSPSEIRITGSKAALAAAMQAKDCTPNEVRFFDREWRAGEDSNPRPPDS